MPIIGSVAIRLIAYVCITGWSSLLFSELSNPGQHMTSSTEPNTGEVSGILRVKFSKLVPADTLETLHHSGLQGTLPDELRELIRRAQGEAIKAVYKVSKEELRDEKYGFARDFELRLHVSADVDAAAEVLRSSSLVDSVRSVVVRHSLDRRGDP